MNEIEALFRYNQPTTLKQLLGFLGLANYYRKFIEHFAEIAHSLYELATANRSNKYKLKGFSEECKKAFEYLRTCLTDETKVLLIPDLEKIFKLIVDSSIFGIGSALTQQDDKGSGDHVLIIPST